MQLPVITAGYTAILALLYALLGLQVVRLRRKNLADFGDGGNTALRNAIRAHAHFAEYVPLIALMAAMLEISGSSAIKIHALMAALLAARLLHPFGMYATPLTWPFYIFRVGGTVITNLVMITCAVMVLSRLLRGG